MTSPFWNFAAASITNIWLGIPFMMIIMLGGLQSIPAEFYDAAEIDGASGWQQFRTITLPMLRPVLTPAVILGTIWTFTEQDFRDLQIWFNLAWTDPDFLAEEPLKGLVDKGRDFIEADKQIIFQVHREIIKGVIPKHKELQDKGQIEITTTPYAHPILPLIYATDLADTGDPNAELPRRFSYPQDAIAHLARSVQIYEDHFGGKPKGLWPSEGAVAQEIVKMV
ncbi:ABC transporter permease subunit, partial [Candidatus Hakubella thermalkaliphila]